MIQKEIDIWLNRDVGRITVPCVQGDSGREIVCHIKDADLPSGAVATYYVEKPSGLAIYNMASVSGNDVTIPLTAQALAEAGINLCQVQIVAGGEMVTTFYLQLKTERQIGEDAEKSGEESTIYQKVAQAAEDAAVSASGASASAADAAESQAAAAQSEAEAEKYARQAAAVFSLAGDVSFVIEPDNSVTMIFTKEDE